LCKSNKNDVLLRYFSEYLKRQKNKDKRTKTKEQRQKNKDKRTKTKEQRQKNKDKRIKTKE
jgi:hypothetical protein